MARDETSAEQAVRTLLQHIGEDPEREGLVRTPHRVVQALDYLTRGYQQDPKVAINGALFLMNVSLSRTLWRRRQALLKHENRLAPGPVTATIADRFSKRGATLSK